MLKGLLIGAKAQRPGIQGREATIAPGIDLVVVKPSRGYYRDPAFHRAGTRIFMTGGALAGTTLNVGF